MRSSDVTFRRQVVDIETPNPNDDDKREMDIIEIKYPDGKVVAFPADHKSPESGVRYRDMFPAKYQAFKNGDPDPDRVEQLNREIEERQNELKSMGNSKDDKRVQENLGYGKVGDDKNPQQARAGRETRDHQPNKIDQPIALGKDEHEPFDQMTKAELTDWIEKNSDERAPSDANKDDLVKLAKKVERKQKVAA